MSDTNKKIGKVLGIGDKLKEFESDEKATKELSEEEKRKRHEERKEQVKKIKAEIAALRNCDDEKFIKDSLREVATIGLQSMRILQEEVEVDPTGRAVECMAAMSNAVSKSLKDLQSVDIDKEKLDIDKEKLNIRRQAALPKGQTTNNILVTGSVTDLLQTIKDQGFENEKEVEEEAEHEAFIESGKGTPFKKDK